MSKKKQVPLSLTLAEVLLLRSLLDFAMQDYTHDEEDPEAVEREVDAVDSKLCRVQELLESKGKKS